MSDWDDRDRTRQLVVGKTIEKVVYDEIFFTDGSRLELSVEHSGYDQSAVDWVEWEFYKP